MGFSRKDILTLASYVHPRLRHNPHAQWLFIWTFPNGGSTAISDLIGQSANARRLMPNCEGRALVPEFDAPTSRMLPIPLVSSRRWRAIWLNRVRKERAPFVIIEKSPDNMARHQHLLNTFGRMHNRSILLTRAPLPTIASWAKRYDISESATRWAPIMNLPAQTRHQQLRITTRVWLKRAEYLLQCRAFADLEMRYEDFCADPAEHVQRIQALMPLLSDIDPRAQVKVKDYVPQPLRNMNADNIAFLAHDEVAVIENELAERSDLVRALGY